MLYHTSICLRGVVILRRYAGESAQALELLQAHASKLKVDPGEIDPSGCHKFMDRSLACMEEQKYHYAFLANLVSEVQLELTNV